MPETHTDMILGFAAHVVGLVGYIDVAGASGFLGIPQDVIVNVLTQNGYVRSGIPTQYIPEKVVK